MSMEAKKLWVLPYLISLVTGVSAYGETLRLQDSVILDGGFSRRGQLIAFRENNSCANWKYIPAELVTTGNAIHTLDFTTAEVGNDKLPAYISSLELMTQPTATNKDVEALRSAIFQRLADFEGCAGKATQASQISLVPALVQSQAGKEPLKAVKKRGFTETFPTYGSANGTYRNPMGPESVTYVLDATYSGIGTRLKQIQESSLVAPVEIGKISYGIDGIVSKIDSRLNLEGEMLAEFESEIKKISCKVEDSSKNLLGDASLFSITTAAFGGFNIKYKEHSTVCHFNLITEFKGGSLKGKSVIDHTRSVLDAGGKALTFTVTNDKGDEMVMSLQDFVEQQLFKMYLLGNYGPVINDLGNNTFAVTLGREGTVKSAYKVDLAYMRSFHGIFGVNIPVYANNLQAARINYNITSDPTAACAVKYYSKQVNRFGSYVDVSPMPIAEECLGKGGGN